MIDISNPYSACESCSRCCKGNRPNRTPFFQMDKDLGRILPEYILNESEPEYMKYSCKYIVDDRCSIYDSRSFICRLFPLYPTYDSEEICMGISLICDAGVAYAARLANPSYREDTLRELKDCMVDIYKYLSLDELNSLCNKTKEYKYRLIVHIN